MPRKTYDEIEASGVSRPQRYGEAPEIPSVSSTIKAADTLTKEQVFDNVIDLVRRIHKCVTNTDIMTAKTIAESFILSHRLEVVIQQTNDVGSTEVQRVIATKTKTDKAIRDAFGSLGVSPMQRRGAVEPDEEDSVLTELQRGPSHGKVSDQG